MSIMMVLEADECLCRAEVQTVLAACGIFDITEEQDTLTGNFPLSNMYFVFDDSAQDDTSVTAEGASNIEWRVGSRMIFHYVTANFDECSAELHEFLERLTELTERHFVLSFQSERVYAVRDKNGLQIFEKF